MHPKTLRTILDYEIIDGALDELPTPGSDHATAVVNLLVGPLGVFMPGSEPVLPDIIVALPHRLHFTSKRGIEGPPNLLAEVLC